MMDRLNLAITCFPTFGGSGMIATEIGLAMADRGHRVHFIARALPVRLHGTGRDVVFHEVAERDYPVLVQSSAYPIALASKMIEVASREHLDILHVHYAVPHATAAWMARDVLGPGAPRIMTTLHGTDITLVGVDPSHLPITRFSILRSDAVTAPSVFLRQATYENFDIPESFSIEVIPNFVDTNLHRPRADAARPHLHALFPSLTADELVVLHVSNFRPVKRIADVVAVFSHIAARRPSRLVMVGDGPERSSAERRLHALGLSERVAFLGEQEHIAPLLAEGDVFLLPSETESFGLAALEALSCGIPVVASNVGGIPEVVQHGINGLLAPVGDVAAMARHVLTLCETPERWRQFARQARDGVLARFQLTPAVDRYEAAYRRLLDGGR